MIGSKNKIAQHRAASRLSCCKMGFDPILHVHLNIYVDFVGYFIVVYTMSYRESLDVWNLIFLGFQLLSSGVIRSWQWFPYLVRGRDKIWGEITKFWCKLWTLISLDWKELLTKFQSLKSSTGKWLSLKRNWILFWSFL